jgi:hypothetical protein
MALEYEGINTIVLDRKDLSTYPAHNACRGDL